MKLFQTKEWKKVMSESGYKPVDISGMYAFEMVLKTFLGKKKIIFARGSLNKLSLIAFIEKSKNYFYGTIAPKIIDYDDDMFGRLGFKRVDDFTMLINLEKTEEELWQNLEKKSARWGVKTAEKNSLVFEEAKKSELNKIYSIYEKTVESGNFKSDPIGYFRAIFKYLLPSNLAKIFVVKKKNKIIAASILFIDPEYTMLNMTCASKEGYKLQAMPFLYWNMIKFSKNLGKKYFDLAGYDKEARYKEKTYLINKFKENFGGQIVPQPIYATNWKYPFIRRIIKSLRIIKMFYSKSAQ